MRHNSLRVDVVSWESVEVGRALRIVACSYFSWLAAYVWSVPRSVALDLSVFHLLDRNGHAGLIERRIFDRHLRQGWVGKRARDHIGGRLG